MLQIEKLIFTFRFLHSELAHNEQRKLEDRIRVQSDQAQKAQRRACDAEIELLNLRRETVLRPGEHRLREVDGIW